MLETIINSIENILASKGVNTLLTMISIGIAIISIWFFRVIKEDIVTPLSLLIADILIFIPLLLFQNHLSKEKFRNTALTLPQITTLSSNVSKLCLKQYFHLNNINIVYTPKLAEAFNHADCKLQIDNIQSCTCEITEHTLNHTVDVTSTCKNDNGKIDCTTNEKLY